MFVWRGLPEVCANFQSPHREHVCPDITTNVVENLPAVHNWHCLTHTQAHMYNQHTRGMETTRHRSLVEGGGRKALLKTLHTHPKKKRSGKPDIH